MKSWAVNNIEKLQESKKEMFGGLNGVYRQPSNNLKCNRQRSKRQLFLDIAVKRFQGLSKSLFQLLIPDF